MCELLQNVANCYSAQGRTVERKCGRKLSPLRVTTTSILCSFIFHDDEDDDDEFMTVMMMSYNEGLTCEPNI